MLLSTRQRARRYKVGYPSSAVSRSSYRLLQAEVSHLQTVASYSLALQHRKMSDTPHPKPDNAKLVIKRKLLNGLLSRILARQVHVASALIGVG